MNKLVKIVVCLVCVLVIAQMSFAKDVYTLGVLAFQGAADARKAWQPTAEYLSANTGQKFTLVPLTFKRLEMAVKNGAMDFVICESVGFYQIHEKYGIEPLASRVGIHQGMPLHGVGAAIFTATDSTIRTLSDLKGKKVAAVQRKALMGYQYQTYLLRKKGIEPGKDFELLFAGKPQLALKAVKNGVADAGFIGIIMLRLFEKEGLITGADFRILEPEADDFPYPHTGPILPDMFVGAAKTIDPAFAEDVAAALKEITRDSPAAQAVNIYGWEDPADLSLVQDVLNMFQE